MRVIRVTVCGFEVFCVETECDCTPERPAIQASGGGTFERDFGF